MMDIAKSETFKNVIILNKAVLFLIKLSRYLTDKYFDIVWGYLPKNYPTPNGHPKIQVFEWIKLGCKLFLILLNIKQIL